MKTNAAVLVGKSDAGNPHIRFDEGNVASAKPRRGSLLYKLLFGSFAVACGCCALAPVSAFADLPEGWRQVEFIGSSGSQWIDTGITLTANTRIVCRFSVPFAPVADGWCGSSVATAVMGWVIGATETELTVTYGYANWKMNFKSTIPFDKNVHTLDIANGAQYLDGNWLGNGSFGAMKPTFALFALNENGTAKYFQNYRIRGCQIYDGETLVRDFIPCAQGMNGALYDQVSKDLFENRGTGSFSVPVAGKAFHLASYVECDGTQYVDAGFTPKANTRVIIDLQYVDSGEAGPPRGCVDFANPMPHISSPSAIQRMRKASKTGFPGSASPGLMMRWCCPGKISHLIASGISLTSKTAARSWTALNMRRRDVVRT